MLLQIEGLKKSYTSPDGQRLPVIDVASFALNAGEQVALEGQSGSGKTTFLHLIAGILQADAGKIVLDGRTLSDMPESVRDVTRARHIGYVFQTFNLLQGLSALENVALGMMFGRGADYGRARKLLERVGLEDRLNYRPAQLSVGQQQRVAVARALANHPQLVLADEPTGNLDRTNARDALKLIREACKENGAALLLVSHDRDVLGSFENVKNLSAINTAGKKL